MATSIGPAGRDPARGGSDFARRSRRWAACGLGRPGRGRLLRLLLALLAGGALLAGAAAPRAFGAAPAAAEESGPAACTGCGCHGH